jgi:hypothetical protein
VTFCDVHAPATAADLGAVFFSIDVERPQVDVKLAMDPQSWASCEGTYFADTHRIGDTCPTQAPTGTPAPAPKTAGSTWTGALFEHFEANFKGGNKALFKNLLNIDAKDSTTSFRFDYGLCTPFGSLESDVLGKKATPGALLEDCGFAQVSDSTSTSSLVSGIKALRFAPLPGVSGLGAWLHLSLEYLVDQIADVGVCCGVEGVEPPICDYVDQDCRQAPRSKTQTGWPKTPLCK